MLNKKVPFLLILTISIMLSCVKGSDTTNNSENITQFKISTSSFDNKIYKTSNNQETDFENIECYLFNTQNKFIDINTIYVPDESAIKFGGLKDGEYFVIVLAVKEAADSDEYTIAKPTNLSDDKWLTIENSSKPLNNNYFYTKHPFTVTDGVVSDPSIKLSNICGLVDFRFNYKNDYTRNSVEEIRVYPTNLNLSNMFLKNGTYDGLENIEGRILSDSKDKFAIKLMPHEEGLFEGVVEVKLNSHDEKKIVTKFNFSTHILPNKRSVVQVDIITPLDNVGTTHIAREDYNATNFGLILTDEEPKEVYSDEKQRYFYPNNLLQSNLTGDNFHLRFYSPVPIDNVHVYAKVEGISDYVDFAFVEHIPAFADINFTINKTQENLIYKTEKGGYVEIPSEKFNSENISFKIKSNDPYWQKIDKIEVDWFVKFHLFNANPDVPPYSSGNWYGIRPVHTREVVGLITNIAYMLTLEDFATYVETFQGEEDASGVVIKDGITGNDGKMMDVSTIIPIFNNLYRLNIGLVKPSDSVAGLGGGYTFGVPQYAYFGHTSPNAAYGMSLIFHELAHCMGFSHSSRMTWGAYPNWPNGIANVFYVDNLHRFPVDANYLNSSENPNIY